MSLRARVGAGGGDGLGVGVGGRQGLTDHRGAVKALLAEVGSMPGF